MSSLESELASYERVRSLFEFQPAEGDALLTKLTSFTSMYRTYTADYAQVQAILSKSDWIEPAMKAGPREGWGGWS